MTTSIASRLKLKHRFVGAFKDSPPLSEQHIRWLLISFFGLIPSLVMVYAVGAPNFDAVFDFMSYLLPCAAGGLAGAGLFFRAEKAKDAQLLSESSPSQSCPAAAGSLPNHASEGGYGITQTEEPKRRDAGFYALSVLALFTGIIFYTLAHKTCRAPAAVACSLFYIAPVTCILWSRVQSGDTALTRAYSDGIAFTMVILIVVAAVVGVIFFPKLF